MSRFCLGIPVAMILVLSAAAAMAVPRGVRVTIYDDPATTMAISWNSSSASDDEVSFGTSPDSLTSSQTAQEQIAQVGVLGTAFSARLSGLSPSTTYYYRVGSSGSLQPPIGSDPFAFETLSADPCDPFRFVVLGSSRADLDGIGPSAFWPPILAEALAHEPDFLVHLGDMVKNGDDPVEWSGFIDASEFGLAETPALFVQGNHDEDDVPHPNAHFSQLFELPRNSATATENYYSVDVGPLHLSVLDSNLSGSQFDDMLGWLSSVLAGSARIWNLTFLHHSVYSRGGHPTGEYMAGILNSDLIPILDGNDVDLAFQSGSHLYERFAPTTGIDVAFGGSGRVFPAGNGAANGPGSALVDGETATSYVGSGGAGSLKDICLDSGCTLCTGINFNCDASVYDADREGTGAIGLDYHYVVIDVAGAALIGEVWTTVAGNTAPPAMVDSFSIANSSECESIPVPTLSLWGTAALLAGIALLAAGALIRSRSSFN